MEHLEDRLAPATFVWTNGGGTGLFSTASNWSNAATGAAGTPTNGDSLVFPLNGPSAPGTVTDDLAAITNFNSITFLSAGWTIAANAGSTVGLTNAINDTTNIAGTNTVSAPLSLAAATSTVGVNVVNPDGAAQNILTLSGNTDLGAAGLTSSGFGELTLSGTLSNSTGKGGIVANGPGSVLLIGINNTQTGPTTINGGVLVVSHPSGLGAATAPVTVNNGGTLNLQVSLIANPLTLNGLGFGGNGALQFAANGLTYAGAITLQTSSSINIFGNSSTLAGAGGNTTGSISGPGGLTVVGVGGINPPALTDADAGTYTGVTNVLGAGLTLGSPAAGQTGGQNTGTPGYVVSQGGNLAVDDSVQATTNRLGTATSVELDGALLTFPGLAPTINETFAALNLGNAAPGIIGTNLVQVGGIGTATITVGTLNRSPGSTVTFSAPNLGSATQKITFGSGAGLVNGILPYALASANLGVQPTDFATQGANGITTAASTATPVLQGGNAVGNGLDNLKLTGTLSLVANTFINSLNLNGNGVNLNGFRLIIGSGGLLNNATTNNITIQGPGELDFGTTANAQGGTATTIPFPADNALLPVEGILSVVGSALGGGSGNVVLTNVAIAVGHNLTFNDNAAGIYSPGTGGVFFNGAGASSSYTGVTWLTSGTLSLVSTVAANLIPTTLVIGDNSGGAQADTVIVASNFQQLGIASAPDKVVINSSGVLQLNAGDNQSVGALTFNSGLSEAQVQTAAALTVTGTVTSGGVVLAPTANLPGGIPDVSNFNPSAFHNVGGTGSLVLAPAGGGTTAIFSVAKTPAVFSGGEEDLHIAVPINAPGIILDKQGTGVLVVFTLPTALGAVQIDGGEFATGVALFAQPITVNAGGTLGSDPTTPAAPPGNGSTVGPITVDGGTVNPGILASPLAPSSSQNGFYANTSNPNFSAAGVLSLHINGYGTTAEWDQFEGTIGAGNTVVLGGTSLLTLDLLGLATSGTLTGKVPPPGNTGASPFIWANPLAGRFSDAPNQTNNILPAADVLNNPTGFQAIVSYGMGFITVALSHPATVPNSTYNVSQNTPLTISTRSAGVLANLTDPDFNGAIAQALQDMVNNPGTITGPNGGTLKINADGTFTYTPANNFTGQETFTLTAIGPLGATSTPFTVTFRVPGGSNFDELGAYRPANGSWSLDSNSQFGFQFGGPEGPSPLSDRVMLGFIPPGVNLASVIPVSGDWANLGTSEIGDFVNGTWYLDLNNNGIVNNGETFTFGTTGDLPVPGDWLAPNQVSLAVFRSNFQLGFGQFIISDANWLAEAQAGKPIGIATSFIFGAAGDNVVVGDWNGKGLTEVGVYRPATAFGAPNAYVWTLDINNVRNFNVDPGKVFIFGAVGDGVVIGDWNNSGTSKVGVYRAATAFGAPNTAVFSLDFSGQFQFIPGQSQVFLFGVPTDRFVTGRWAFTTSVAPAKIPGGAADPLTDPTALDAFFAAN